MYRSQAERISRSHTIIARPLLPPPVLFFLLLCVGSSLTGGCETRAPEHGPAQVVETAPLADGGQSPSSIDPSPSAVDPMGVSQQGGAQPFDAAGSGLLDPAAQADAAKAREEAGAGSDAAVLGNASSLRDAGPSDASMSEAGMSDAGRSDPGSEAGLSHDASLRDLGDGGADTGTTHKPAPLADQTQPTMVNGISIDESGYLWVAAGSESQLLRLEPPGEKIVERHATQWELDGPDDLVATPEAIYYTAMAAGNVNKLDRRTGKNSVLGAVGIGVNPIVLTSSGTLLVGLAPGPVPELAPLFTGLFEVDKTGVQRPRTILRDSRSINAFCVAPDGYAYGPTQTAVLRIDLSKSTFTTLHEGFGYAGAVRYNPRDQQLYVLDVAPTPSPRAAILYRMGLDGSGFAVFARLSAVAKDEFSADNFAIAEDGTFYVTRLYAPKITRVSADGSRAEDFVIGKP